MDVCMKEKEDRIECMKEIIEIFLVSKVESKYWVRYLYKNSKEYCS